ARVGDHERAHRQPAPQPVDTPHRPHHTAVTGEVSLDLGCRLASMSTRSSAPSLVDRVFGALDHVAPPTVAYAHCDIPCGIYDPHAAQLAALTVIRMVQLIQGLQKPADGAAKEEWDTYAMQI